MKKLLTGFLTLVLFSPLVVAENGIYDVPSNVMGVMHQKKLKNKLLDSIKIRHHLYFNEMFGERRTDRDNYIKHGSLKSSRHVGSGVSDIKRGGDSDYYEGIIPRLNYRVQRPNHNQVFRRRLVCYYVNGENPGTDCLENGDDLIDGENNIVPRIKLNYNNNNDEDVAEIKRKVHSDFKKAIYKEENISTSDRKNTYSKGSYYRNFDSPYWDYEFNL